MSTVAVCPNGHRWSLAEPQSVADADGLSLCPECGTLVAGHSLQTAVDRADGSWPGASLSEQLTVDAADDEYELLEELGRGGMGVVYKARHRSLDRIVALKMILDGQYASRDQVHRFRREATALARLQHPNIVQVHHVGEMAGRPFLCLEFVEQGSLVRKLNGTPQRADIAACLVERLARAVSYMHGHGVLHRDLKPANVLLAPADGGCGIKLGNGPDESGHYEPKIADFGLAKRLDGQDGATHTGDFLGTPSYMAPEQVAGNAKVVGRAVDVYALGAILYELLTGRPPFTAASPAETYRQIVSEEPVPPRRLVPKLPQDLETICLKCLEKEPCKRYRTAQELADDLRRYVAGEPITARATPLWERARKWTRRRPGTAAVLAVGALGILAVLAVVLSSNAQLARERDVARQAQAEAALAHFELAYRLHASGSKTDALATYQKSRDLLELLPHTGPRAPEIRNRLGSCYINIGEMQKDTGNLPEAFASYQRAAALFEELIAADPSNDQLCHRLVVSWNNMGEVRAETGQSEEAMQFYKHAEELVENFSRTDTRFEAMRPACWRLIGNLQAAQGQWDAALTAYEQGRNFQEQRVAESPDDTTSEDVLGLCYFAMGEVYRACGEFTEAATSLAKARALHEKIVGADGTNNHFRSHLAATLAETAELHHATGEPEVARQLLERAREIQERLVARNPDDVNYRSDLGRTLDILGTTLQELGSLDLAVATCLKAYQHHTMAVTKAPTVTRYQKRLNDHVRILGHMQQP